MTPFMSPSRESFPPPASRKKGSEYFSSITDGIAKRISGRFIRAEDNTPTATISTSPFVYWKTQELVWKWDQRKLCGARMNMLLNSSLLPHGHAWNVPDKDNIFVSVGPLGVIVHEPAHLRNLDWSECAIGVSQDEKGSGARIILQGRTKRESGKSLSKLLVRFKDPILPQPLLPPISWSTEFWMSDSVVLDPRLDEGELIIEGLQLNVSGSEEYLYIGLPGTDFGALFNTLITSWGTSEDCFKYSCGYFWLLASISPVHLAPEAHGSSFLLEKYPLSFREQMRGESWLVAAKITLKLQRPSRLKSRLQVQVHAISSGCVTSTRRPAGFQ
ncbi:hypothetical protein N7478_003788 [Penicillium angulare]|uniref:uncharacterized protein n=1 Tax=Penicillium angulare TaxID=116970 RepID=UPI00253F7D59|nr:uncharacterized protein N7478_003788 [Penicillium angulare]KAJ5288102.1 hypothetical protein N7478_003788 [Penicillium angulare]